MKKKGARHSASFFGVVWSFFPPVPSPDVALFRVVSPVPPLDRTRVPCSPFFAALRWRFFFYCVGCWRAAVALALLGVPVVGLFGRTTKQQKQK